MKKNIRKEVLSSLKQLSQEKAKKEKIEDIILLNLFNSVLWRDSQTIGVTLSMLMEFNTEKLIEKALSQGKVVCIPKTFEKGQMSFYQYELGDELKTTSFGVLEPLSEKLISKEQIDLLVVPGVAFNSLGYRIGFGGGFYDRYLDGFKGNTCSLVFDEQLTNKFEPESHDLPVSKLFTLISLEENNESILK